MKGCVRSFSILLLLLSISEARALSPQQETKATPGSITGHVKVGDKPAQGVILILLRINDKDEDSFSFLLKPKNTVKTTTDADGIYRFTNLPPGEFAVFSYAPAMTEASDFNVWAVREVKVGEGEAVENIDMGLTQGGVITGQATDAKGRPVIGQMIMLEPAGDNKLARYRGDFLFSTYFMTINRTDDRGIYRLYGLPPGRYLVSLQAAQGAGYSILNMNYGRYDDTQTFHPGVTDKGKAMPVEVKAGSETNGIDIRVGLPPPLFTASGRIIDAETGKPVTSIAVRCELDSRNPGYYVHLGMAIGASANTEGEFKFASLPAGKYTAKALLDEDSNFYSETLPFEVTNGNVSGITIKLHRGQTVSGVVVIEGPTTTDPQTIIAQLPIQATIEGNQPFGYQDFPIKPAADGSFRLIGVHPGQMNFSLDTHLARIPYKLRRVEYNGTQSYLQIAIPAGENVTGVRLVFAEISGVIRGQLKTSDDTPLPKGQFVVKSERLTDRDADSLRGAAVDEKGSFEITGLLPGEYELTVYLAPTNPGDASKPNSKSDDSSVVAQQRVTVPLDKEANITLVITDHK